MIRMLGRAGFPSFEALTECWLRNPTGWEGAMIKTLAMLGVAAALATGAVAIPTSQANAACFGCYVGAGIAAGLIGGALIAGATAPAYGYAPVYAGPACGWQTQRVWNGYGWQYQRVRVCY
jgi:hypothetical protein